jgi:hypothetical protein
MKATRSQHSQSRLGCQAVALRRISPERHDVHNAMFLIVLQDSPDLRAGRAHTGHVGHHGQLGMLVNPDDETVGQFPRGPARPVGHAHIGRPQGSQVLHGPVQLLRSLPRARREELETEAGVALVQQVSNVHGASAASG